MFTDQTIIEKRISTLICVENNLCSPADALFCATHSQRMNLNHPSPLRILTRLNLFWQITLKTKWQIAFLLCLLLFRTNTFAVVVHGRQRMTLNKFGHTLTFQQLAVKRSEWFITVTPAGWSHHILYVISLNSNGQIAMTFAQRSHVFHWRRIQI